MKYKMFAVIILTLVIISCSRSVNVQKEIIRNSVENEIINFQAIFDFSWTDFYVFSPKIKSSQISTIIGAEFDYDTDIDRVIVVMNKEHIVHFYIEGWNPEKYFDLEFNFDGKDYIHILPNDSTFEVINKEYLLLRHKAMRGVLP